MLEFTYAQVQCDAAHWRRQKGYETTKKQLQTRKNEGKIITGKKHKKLGCRKLEKGFAFQMKVNFLFKEAQQICQDQKKKKLPKNIKIRAKASTGNAEK